MTDLIKTEMNVQKYVIIDKQICTKWEGKLMKEGI